MSIVSVRQVERFVPYAWRDDKGAPKDGAPVYLIRPPSIMSKARWRRDVAAAGAVVVSHDDLQATLRRGIREVVADHQQDRLLALVDRYDQAFRALDTLRRSGSGTLEEMKAAAEALAEVSGEMSFLEGEMRGHYPPYAQKLADQQFWFEVAPVIAAQLFLAGWEGLDLEYAQENGRVPEVLLGQIDPDHLFDIGWRAIGLTGASKADEKNSGGASGSGANRTRSPRTRKAPGSSTAKRSSKTRR